MQRLAERLFSRVTAAHVTTGNSVELLKNGAENYGRWIEAIEGAQSHIYFENYYVQEDATGREIAEALKRKAHEGIRVYVLYDWLGNFRLASRKFWQDMREAGIEVRAYNPPNPLRPFTMLSRDHRKTLVVDNEVGFVSGLCVGDEWVGAPAKNVDPWRDTGIEIRGMALVDLEIAFARSWSAVGSPLATFGAPPTPAGETRVRIVASDPSTTGMLRLDELIAGLATRRIWLTDPYYNGVDTYEEALSAAAKDGVDVRLLTPGKTDLPLLRPFSMAGFRTLLEAGVRVYQWDGTMLHAKSAVVDGQWSRVGSTNLNVASWMSNRELDAVIEDRDFGRQMEEMFLDDLKHSTELIIDADDTMKSLDTSASGSRSQPKAVDRWSTQSKRRSGERGKRSKETARALGSLTRATVNNRRDLTAREAGLSLYLGSALALIGTLSFIAPRPLAFTIAIFMVWIGVSFAADGIRRISGAEEDDTDAPR